MERRVLAECHILPTPYFSQGFSILRSAPIWQRFQARDESGQLLLPIVECRSGGNDEKRSPEVMHFG